VQMAAARLDRTASDRDPATCQVGSVNRKRTRVLLRSR